MSETAAYETRADAGDGQAGEVRLWLEAITLARKTEEDWRKKAVAAVERYRDEKSRKGRRFNILFANTQTVLPAIYNSTPVPDIRRRFGDADEIGKLVAQMLERALSYSADVYDFDGGMRAVCWDAVVVGRGAARVRYDATVQGDQIADEEVSCDYVDWRDFIRGPGRRWSEVPWIAFEHRLTREELVSRFGDVGATMPLDFIQDGAAKDDDRDVAEVFKRGTVYEVWDKQAREVLFVAQSVPTKALKREPDPLRLRDFWPMPRPVYDTQDTGSLVPLVPFELYRDQAEELDRVTARITALVNVLRFRGFRDASVKEWQAFADAADGELVPIENAQQFTSATGGGGLERAFYLMPIENLIGVIKELVVHREEIKRVIYEITGLSDILRGASEAQETATAQRIKSQWGALRIQERQAEVQRFARDLFRLKAEIIAERFQPATLGMMTGIQLPDAAQKEQAVAAMQQAQAAQQEPPPELMEAAQSPSWDDVLKVLRSDALRSYSVDIETDSTIQADVARNQENAARFVEGLGGFITSVGPAVAAGQFPREVAADLMSAFSRQFKLGRQAEDAMEKLKAAPPPPAQGDPMEAEKAKLAAEGQKHQAEMQLKNADMQQRGQLDAAKLAMEHDNKRLDREQQMMLERERMDREDARHAASLGAEREKMAVGAELQLGEREASAGLEREKLAATERQSKEAAAIKAAPESKAAEQISALAEGVQEVAKTVAEIGKQVNALGEAVAEVAEDMAAPVEAVRGGDGRIAEVRRGKRVLKVARGEDGKAAGLI